MKFFHGPKLIGKDTLEDEYPALGTDITNAIHFADGTS